MPGHKDYTQLLIKSLCTCHFNRVSYFEVWVYKIVISYRAKEDREGLSLPFNLKNCKPFWRKINL
jgi:hypothetical protein